MSDAGREATTLYIELREAHERMERWQEIVAKGDYPDELSEALQQALNALAEARMRAHDWYLQITTPGGT